MGEVLNTFALAITAFRNAAISKADFATPPKVDHELYAVMADAWHFCRSSDEGLIALRQLLNDDSDPVRLSAAAGLLSIGEVSARPTLEALAQRSDLLGFIAQMVLQEFDAGRARSPFGT